MKRYELAELIKRWEREELTVEQTIGQLLLWLDSLIERMNSMEIRQRRLEQQKPK